MKRLTLLQRYCQLTLWNKIGLWGSVASVVGLALFFLSTSSPSSWNTHAILWLHNSTVVQAGRDATIYNAAQGMHVVSSTDSAILPYSYHGEEATYREMLRSADLDVVVINTFSKSVGLLAEYHWMDERYSGYTPERLELRLIRKKCSIGDSNGILPIHLFNIRLKDGFHKTIAFDFAGFKHNDLENCQDKDEISLGRVIKQFDPPQAIGSQANFSLPTRQAIVSEMFSHYIIASRRGFFAGGIVTIIESDLQELAACGGILATLHNDASRRSHWWQLWKKG